ncbi:MAG: PAS domain S-box protein [Verrucomicrobia bacterium]|nr:PAS domain S-box protein [Verrucomicrobiota bacterium]
MGGNDSILKVSAKQTIQNGFTVALFLLLFAGGIAWWSIQENIEAFRNVEPITYVILAGCVSIGLAGAALLIVQRDIRTRRQAEVERDRLSNNLKQAEEALLRSENSLQSINNEWEARVTDRMSQLSRANEQLRREIGEREKVEKALAQQESHYRTLFELSLCGILLEDKDGTILEANEAVCKLFGYSREESRTELLGKNIRTLVPQEHRAQIDHNIREILAGKTLEHKVENIAKDGSVRQVELRETAILLGDGSPGILVTAEDITGRRRADQQLRLLAQAIATTAEMISITDANDRFTFVNRAFLNAYGYTAEEVLGRTPEILFSDRNPPQLMAAILAGARDKGWSGEVLDRRKDGSEFCIYLNTSPVLDEKGHLVGLMGVARDITERKTLERRALRSQRLESIGTLAGGVAHDLNNALAPIIMGVELLRMDYPNASEIVDIFENSAMRSSDMVRQLLTFAKGAEGERVSIDPKRLVKEIEKIIKGTFPKNIHLTTKCDKELLTVLGDATQLHQVLLNLCVNARDAMPSGGNLTLEGRFEKVDATFARSEPQAKPGDYVALRVRDTGTGISSEVLDRMFDPFFTTKGPEHGTGLGLSTVMEIVKGHGGFVQVESRLGQGSTFSAYFPTDRTGREARVQFEAATEFRGGGETILFVDDEPAVREVARAVLRRLNCNPITATDGMDALIQLAENRLNLRAIITDLHMPHMDGLAFVRAVRNILPDLPIVLASGRLDDGVAEEFKTLGVTNRLDKPFTEGQLASILKKVLSSK